MLPDQNFKSATTIVPQSVATTEITATVDTIGYDHATVIFALDTAAASSVITTASVAEGPTTSAYTAIAAAEGGTAWTFPTPSTSAGDIIVGSIPLGARQRYLQIGLASTTARLSAVSVHLSRGDQVPVDTTTRNSTLFVA